MNGLPGLHAWSETAFAGWIAFCAAGAIQAADPPQPLDRPYAPLMAVVGGGRLLPNPSDEKLEFIARTWSMVNSHGLMINPSVSGDRPMPLWAGRSAGTDAQGRTIGQRLKALNPDFVLSNYRNGSYVSQNCPEEAAEAESRFPLSISVHDTGARLKRSLEADSSTVALDPAGAPPKGMPRIYPFKASTTAGEHSQSTKAYVAWIRLGGEILRIDQARALEDGTIELAVRRGIWGTKAAAHAQGAMVLQPVYIGANTGIDAPDNYLSGRPDANAPQPGLRYAFQVQKADFQQWLGDKCQAIFDDGYDVVWLDVSVSTWYNNANAYGYPVVPWNLAAAAPLDNSTYREYQQRKADALFARFPNGRFFINNVKGSCYFKAGQDRRQLSGEGGHHPLSGGSMEMYASAPNEEQWREIVDMTLDFVRSDFWGVAWAKGGRGKYWQFAYGTFLLAYRPGARLMFAPGESGGLPNKPAEFLYWDLGEPLETFDSAEDARHAHAKGVFCRRFAKGLVLVNPSTAASETVHLDGEFYDPETRSWIAQTAIEGKAAKLLLR
ncbi:MAG: hypothetical protein BWZ10_01670 [candidate division BRC1 bacterium ADurb.BinA364]|nr:MAG: hypothetical protein BWZ10_01670 [candidate division BRC1 bacterium ADurb.BinA364]